ncbi:MAG: hypothetical protein ACOC5R_01815 [Elusimicrobiota bacterium]
MISQDAIEKLPKVDLHCHLESSIRKDTLFEIAEKENIDLGNLNKKKKTEEIKKYLIYKNKDEFNEQNIFFCNIFKNQTGIARAAYELCVDSYEDNVRYLEIRSSPSLYDHNIITVSESIDAVFKGMHKAEEEFSMKCGLIISLFPSKNIKHVNKIIEYAINNKENRICGIDIPEDEIEYFSGHLKEQLEQLKRKNIFITVNAGELEGVEKIRKGLKLGPHRLGNAVSLIEDEKLLDIVAERNITVEVCMSSNVKNRIVESYDKHPVKEMLKRGIKVVFNTDNRGISSNCLADEYKIACKMGINFPHIVDTVINGVDGAFLEPVKKEKLKQWFEKICIKLLSGK